MTRWNIIWVVFRKELLDTLRDKKTLLINVGLPIILYPLIIIVLGNVVANDFEPPEEVQTVGKADEEGKAVEKSDDPYEVALVGEAMPGLEEHLNSLRKVVVKPWDGGTGWSPELLEPNEVLSAFTDDDEDAWPEALENLRAMGEETIQEDTLDLILWQVPDGEVGEGYENYDIFVLFDMAEKRSRDAREYVNEALDDLFRDLRKERLERLELDTDYVIPFSRDSKELTSPDRKLIFLAGGAVPYLLIIMLILSSFYPAVDVTAGEKEHGTLPTVLCAPISPVELVLGKFLLVTAVAMVGATANLLSMVVVYLISLRDTVASIPASLPLVVLATFLPLAMLISAISITISSFAKNFKEAQNLMTPFLLLAMLPGFAAMAPSVMLTPSMALVPVLNVTLLIKGLLMQTVSVDLVFLTLLSNLAYSFGFLVLAAKVFSSEQILHGGDAGIEDILTLDRDAIPRPNMGFAIVLFCALLVLGFYVNSLMFPYGILALLAVVQLGVMLAVPLGAAVYYRFDLGEVLSLRRPSNLTIGLSVAVGSTLWLSLAWLQRIIPPPEEWNLEFVEALTQDIEGTHVLAVIFFFGVLPGICEEIAFRGVIMQGLLERLKPWQAIVLQGLLFGAIHFSIYRLLPTTAIGIVLGVIVWRTKSIIPAMLIHGINNSLLMIILRNEERFEAYGITENTSAWPLVAVGTLITAAALYGIHKLSEDETAA